MTLDLLGPLDLLAEGEQELQGHQEPMDLQAVLGHRGQWDLRVKLDFLVPRAQMDLRVFLGPSPKAVVIFCVLPSALLVLRALQGCQGSRVTPAIKETRERLEKMERREILAYLVPLGFQGLWACRAHVV